MTLRPPLTDQEAWLWLAAAQGVGFRRLRPLLERFGSPKALLSASDRELKEAGASQKVIAALRKPDPAKLEAALRWLEAGDHHLLTPSDPDFPPLLREIPDPPLLLFAAGRPEVVGREAIAIVGTRRASQEGLRIAFQFARELAGVGFLIVSGLAHGIDGAAHRGALAAGTTAAVMGTGPDRIYPREHEELAAAIRQQGVLLSESFPGTEPAAGLFPRRNRLIAGMARATLVVEAGEKSGALITARLALDYNREVMAVPGSIQKPQARGCHRLIQEGARLVTSPEELLEELRPILGAGELFPSLDDESPHASGKERVDEHLPPPLASILEQINFVPTPIDLIAARTGLPVEELLPKLLELELEGYISGQDRGGVRRLK